MSDWRKKAKYQLLDGTTAYALVWDGIDYLLPEPLIDEILRDHELAVDELGRRSTGWADDWERARAAEAERDQLKERLDNHVRTMDRQLMEMQAERDKLRESVHKISVPKLKLLAELGTVQAERDQWKALATEAYWYVEMYDTHEHSEPHEQAQAEQADWIARFDALKAGL